MYENETYEEILERSLNRVGTNVDKREGSVIMSAIAPVSAEHAHIYTLLEGIIRDGYADTATREYLILRCKERGIVPYEATKAVLKGKFTKEVPIGSRWSLSGLFYTVITFISSDENFYYQLECESTGTEGNKYFGELSPVDYASEDLSGELVELLIPAEDNESTEDLRLRYFGSLKSSAFGGNRRDYIEKTDSLDGVGGTVVVPVWNGGGTVKLIIINSDFNVASDTLIAKVQEAVDPDQSGTGLGFAPIGHTVTVTTATEVPIGVSTRITFNEGYSWERIQADAISAVEDYFLSMRKAWEGGGLVVRVAHIENRLLNLDGVIDIADTTINGGVDNIVIAFDEIPVLGGIVNE